MLTTTTQPASVQRRWVTVATFAVALIVALALRPHAVIGLIVLFALFVPLEKLFFGTDYPGFLYDPVKLRDKLMTVNEEAAAVSLPPIPEQKLLGVMGDNLAAVLGLDDA